MGAAQVTRARQPSCKFNGKSKRSILGGTRICNMYNALCSAENRINSILQKYMYQNSTLHLDGNRSCHAIGALYDGASVFPFIRLSNGFQYQRSIFKKILPFIDWELLSYSTELNVGRINT